MTKEAAVAHLGLVKDYPREGPEDPEGGRGALSEEKQKELLKSDWNPLDRLVPANTLKVRELRAELEVYEITPEGRTKAVLMQQVVAERARRAEKWYAELDRDVDERRSMAEAELERRAEAERQRRLTAPRPMKLLF